MYYHLGHGFDGALIGFLASGFFITVLHYPYFWINLSMVVALRVCAGRELAAAGRSASRSRRSRGVEPARSFHPSGSATSLPPLSVRS